MTGGTGTPGGGQWWQWSGNGGMMPSYDLTVNLSRVGEGPVNAGDEVVLNVGVDGLMDMMVTGGEIYHCGRSRCGGDHRCYACWWFVPDCK